MPGISDHDIVFAELDLRPVKHSQKPRQIPLYKKAKWDLIREDMAQLRDSISTMYDARAENVNDMWITFRDTLQANIATHIPHKQTESKDKHPWIGPELKRLTRKQHRYYKQKKKTGDPLHAQKYMELKHLVQKRTRQAYWDYVEGIVTPGEQENEHNSRKRFWTYVKHKRSDNTGASSLKSDGKLFSHPKDKAEILNKQFQSVFSSSEEVSQEDFSRNYNMPTEESSFPVLDDIDITLNGIKKLLKDLNPNKSPGPDNIGPRVLKELAEDIAPLLLMIYRKSLDTGEVPEDWRTANVTPAFKKGQKYQAENYRPISLTSVCCKIMEHVITSQIMNHGENNNILYPLQHGFRRGRSCETQLIEFIDDLSSNLQKNQQTDVLNMDFAKAFDKVCHSLLVHKLHHYGIRGKVNNWIKNWLTNRKQCVVVEGEKSQFVIEFSGVPQGSVLGPCLFLYYINDLAAQLHSTVRFYADETIAYLVVETPEDASLLQEDLNTLAKWEDQWRMKFHPSKCTKMTVTSKRSPTKTEYNLHGHILASVPSAKYLGVTITDYLQWDTHIQNICDKANRTIGFLRRNLNIGAVSIKQQAYLTLFRPLIEYASTVWDPYTQANIQKLEIVQRRAARYVMNRQRNTSSVSDMLQRLNWRSLESRRNRQRNTSSVSDMLQRLNWRSLESRRKDARLCMMFKIDRRLVAISKEPRLQLARRKTTRLQHYRAFQIITCRTDKRKMSFFPRTVKDWNALAPHIIDSETLEAFKASVSSMEY